MKLKSEHEKLYDRQLRAWGHNTQEKIISTICIFDTLDCITFETIRNLTLLGFDILVKHGEDSQPVCFFGTNIIQGFDDQITWLNSLNELAEVKRITPYFKSDNSEAISFVSLPLLKTQQTVKTGKFLFIYTEKYKGYSFLFVIKNKEMGWKYLDLKERILPKLDNQNELKSNVKFIIKELLNNNTEYNGNVLESRMFGSTISRRVVDFIINPIDASLFVFNCEEINATDYKL